MSETPGAPDGHQHHATSDVPPPPPPPGQWYGQPPGYGYGYVPQPPQDGLGIASMVLGILGLVGMCAYGLGMVLAVPALVMGRISMNRITAANGQLGGRGLAQAGFIMGIIGTSLGALWIIFWVVIVVVGMSGGFA